MPQAPILKILYTFNILRVTLCTAADATCMHNCTFDSQQWIGVQW